MGVRLKRRYGNSLLDAQIHELMKPSFGEYMGASFSDSYHKNIMVEGIESAKINRLDSEPARDVITSMKHGNIQTKTIGSNEPRLSTEELNEEFGLNGELTFDKPMKRVAAQRLYDNKREELKRLDVIRRYEPGVAAGVAGFGAALVAQALDPINIAASFVPVVPQARAAAMMARFGKTTGRLAVGAIEGTVGNLALEPLMYAGANNLQYEYDAYDSLMNVTFGGIIGAGFHAGIGKIGDMVSPKTDVIAKQTAISQMLNAEEINVEPIIQTEIIKRLRTPKIADNIYDTVSTNPKFFKDVDGPIQCHDCIGKLKYIYEGYGLKFIEWDEAKYKSVVEVLKNSKAWRQFDDNSKELIEGMISGHINGHSFIKHGKYYIDPYLKDLGSSDIDIQKLGNYLENVYNKAENLNQYKSTYKKLNTKEGSQKHVNRHLRKSGYPLNVIEGKRQALLEQEADYNRFIEDKKNGKSNKRAKSKLEKLNKAKEDFDEFVRINDDGKMVKAIDSLKRTKKKLSNNIKALENELNAAAELDYSGLEFHYVSQEKIMSDVVNHNKKALDVSNEVKGHIEKADAQIKEIKDVDEIDQLKEQIQAQTNRVDEEISKHEDIVEVDDIIKQIDRRIEGIAAGLECVISRAL